MRFVLQIVLITFCNQLYAVISIADRHLLFTTVLTAAIKISYMSLNFALKAFTGDLRHALHKRKIKIGNASAIRADKVIMRRGIEIKTVCAVAYSQSCDFPDIGKQSQIPVNGSQADIGKGFAHIRIDDIRSRMVFSGGQKFFYSFPLFAML